MVETHLIMKPFNHNGFTIIEVIVAIFLLAVGAGGVYTLINQSLNSMSVLRSHLIASYLAQEGIEVVRNIRDTNWIKGSFWTSGIETAQDCGVDYTSNSCQTLQADQVLSIGSNGFYSYAVGTDTIFKRKITLRKRSIYSADDALEVIVTVSWQERGVTKEFKAKEAIYNWR